MKNSSDDFLGIDELMRRWPELGLEHTIRQPADEIVRPKKSPRRIYGGFVSVESF